MLMGSKNQGIKKLTIRIWVATHLVILPLLNFCHILKENYIGLPHKLDYEENIRIACIYCKYV